LPEEVVEEVAEPTPLAKPEIPHIEVAKIEPFAPSSRTTACLKGTMAQLIILLAEFRAAEDVVSLRNLLETPLRLLVPRIQIGMKFSSQPSISLFNLLIRGRALDPQYFIVITLHC
jgi:hypothetical protein